ncbi:uncharacterized protein EV420DRAFT_1489414 [Desarmillaria tabescens]|uniref:Uncharacterized protein n=1 Tax=Armillaria tabescens TaxID=1929756 RepID=A0AA39J0A1_ARMTA|nr:uncharacterized protein EV420DRAFT_1489414 [Desarmillaria tabescens]KAK0433125.1 hypothetical protein EV420DRAFT_1489414 [Desarmillaria tabescens]
MSSIVLPSRGRCIQVIGSILYCQCQWFFPPESPLLDQTDRGSVRCRCGSRCTGFAPPDAAADRKSRLDAVQQGGIVLAIISPNKCHLRPDMSELINEYDITNANHDSIPSQTWPKEVRVHPSGLVRTSNLHPRSYSEPEPAPHLNLKLSQNICGLCGHGIHVHVDYVSTVVNHYPANQFTAYVQKPWTVLDLFGQRNNSPSLSATTSSYYSNGANTAIPFTPTPVSSPSSSTSSAFQPDTTQNTGSYSSDGRFTQYPDHFISSPYAGLPEGNATNGSFEYQDYGNPMLTRRLIHGKDTVIQHYRQGNVVGKDGSELTANKPTDGIHDGNRMACTKVTNSSDVIQIEARRRRSVAGDSTKRMRHGKGFRWSPEYSNDTMVPVPWHGPAGVQKVTIRSAGMESKVPVAEEEETDVAVRGMRLVVMEGDETSVGYLDYTILEKVVRHLDLNRSSMFLLERVLGYFGYKALF